MMVLGNTSISRAALLVAFILSAPTGAAFAQDKPAAPAGPPPSWEVLMRCAGMTDADAELSCYRSAMRDAGFAASPQVALAEHRKHFGLALPAVNLLRHKPKERGAAARPSNPAEPPAAVVDEDQLSVVLDQVSLIPPFNKLLLITTDGQVWEQLDTEEVNPRPKKGQSIKILRSRFGGYFCKFDRTTSMRCTRTH